MVAPSFGVLTRVGVGPQGLMVFESLDSALSDPGFYILIT